MADYGSLRRFVDMLSTAPSMNGVSVVFGEETIPAQEHATPRITVVPVAGTWNTRETSGASPGYEYQSDPNLQNIWMTSEVLEFHCWAVAPGELAKPIDHANAVENLRALLLQALQSQRARWSADGETKERGLMFRPIQGRWVLANNVTIRMGRVYVLSVQVDFTVPEALPQETTIEHVIVQPVLVPVGGN